MDSLSIILSFIFGAIIGSFLNVVALRFNTGMGLGGRSRCFSCGKTLTWTELVPLASFLFQRGKCRKCKTNISWQYPLVELLTGALFVLVLFKFPPVDVHAAIVTALYLFITCLMLVITVYDIKHKIIPDTLVYIFDTIAFLSIFIVAAGHASVLWAILAGPIYALPFAILWFVSRGKWMGFGDVKLVLGIGWLLGIVAAASAITLAFWTGAAFSLIWMIARFGKVRSHYEIPFAPYLILGMYLVLIFGLNVIDIRGFFELF